MESTNSTPTIFSNETNRDNMNTDQPLSLSNINNTNNDNNKRTNIESTAASKESKKPENFSVSEQIELFLIDSQTFGTSATLNEKIKEAYNQIPHSKFDSKEKQYQFPLQQYNQFQELLSQIPFVKIHKLPNNIEKIFVLKEFRTKPSNLDKIPANLLSQLLPYQKQGILFALERNGKVMLCDEAGLGKTVQAIGISCCYKDEWPIIVICPASLRQHWADVSF